MRPPVMVPAPVSTRKPANPQHRYDVRDVFHAGRSSRSTYAGIILKVLLIIYPVSKAYHEFTHDARRLAEYATESDSLDLHHRFWADGRFFNQPRPMPPARITAFIQQLLVLAFCRIHGPSPEAAIKQKGDTQQIHHELKSFLPRGEFGCLGLRGLRDVLN